MTELSAPDTTPAATTAARNRRAAVRYPCEFEASCQDESGPEDQHWSASVRDISTSGIGLLASRAFDPGTALRLELQSEDQTFAYTLWTRVVHVVPYNDEQWLVGCVFGRSLSADELARLL